MPGSVLVIYDGSRIASVCGVHAQWTLGGIMKYLDLCPSRGDKCTYLDNGTILFEKYIPRYSFSMWSKYTLVAALHPVSHSIGYAPDSLEETSLKGPQDTIMSSKENQEQNTPGESLNKEQPAPESATNPEKYSYIWTPENSSDEETSEEQPRQNTPKESPNSSSSEEQPRQNTPKESPNSSSSEEQPAPEIVANSEKYPFLWKYTSEYLY